MPHLSDDKDQELYLSHTNTLAMLSAMCKNNNTDKTNWRDQNQNFYIIYNYSKKKRPAGMRNITKYIKGSEKCKKYEYRYICI